MLNFINLISNNNEQTTLKLSNLHLSDEIVILLKLLIHQKLLQETQ